MVTMTRYYHCPDTPQSIECPHEQTKHRGIQGHSFIFCNYTNLSKQVNNKIVTALIKCNWQLGNFQVVC